ncbi:MAG: SprT family zinc-dependent metalloprotease [Patescibacteria group bacterium]
MRQSRKTLSLTVMPDMRLLVKVPQNADERRIELFLQKKWLWLGKQMAYFKRYKQKKYIQEYVSGESVRYLGKQYQLIVKRAPLLRVSLKRNTLQVETILSLDKSHLKRIIENWYLREAKQIFRQRLDEVYKRFQYKIMPLLEIRYMKMRWGSYSRGGKIILNPKLIHTSMDCIDYVITHELCHVRYKNHDKYFFNFLDKNYPKWEKVKEKLEVMGSKK